MDTLDIVNFSLHALDIVFRVLDGLGVLEAQRADLSGYINYSDNACCALRAVYNARSAAEIKYAGRLEFALLQVN